MTRRLYYSLRREGKDRKVGKIDLSTLLELFHNFYIKLNHEGYFQEAFGYYCVDEGQVYGSLGKNIEAEVFRRLRKKDIWPIEKNLHSFSEEDLFDVIEFLFDHISKPIGGYQHNFNNCGWHYHTFNKIEGQRFYREEINDLLEEYEGDFELNEIGEVFISPIIGFESLITEKLPVYDPENFEDRINIAIKKFRKYPSTLDDKKNAVRDLADVLEFIRPNLKSILNKKDDALLFELANNFGIRHHNEKQYIKYNKEIWYTWMFYYYLATIHAFLGFINKGKEE